MATLSQTLRGLPQADDQLTRGPGGVLRRTPTLQQATQKAGLAAAPTTPAGAELAGAGPQAAKMAGTPQQMKAALEASAEPQQPDLQTALRRKQYGRAATAGEAATIQKSEDMQKLGGLGDRVTNMVNDEVKKLGALAPKDTSKLGVAVTTAKDFQGAEITPETQGNLQKLLTMTPGTPEYNKLLVDVNTSLGRTTPDKILDASQLQSMFGTAGEAIGTAGAEAIRNLDTVKAAEFLPELGYDANSLASLLGVTPEEVQGYSLADLQNKITEVTNTEFTRTQQLEQQAMSPLTGAAERGLAREAARELSATGIRATEADMQNLNDEINSADQVSFPPGSEPRPLKDLLADENISQMIKDIVESPADSELRKQLARDPNAEPMLKFIERNEMALRAAAARMETGAGEFKKLQEANLAELRKLKISDDLLSKVAPEAMGLQTGKIDITKVPVLNYLSTVSEADRQKISEEMGTAVEGGLIEAKELNTLTPEEYTALGIGKVDSNWSKLLATREHRNGFKNAGSPEEQLKFISNTGVTIPQITAAMSDADKIKSLGLPVGIDVSAFDVNGDGKPDWDKLNEVYNKLNPPQSLKQATKGVNQVKGSPLTIPSISADTITNNYLTLEQARELEKLAKNPNTKIPIDARITAIKEGKERTPQRINNEIINKPLENPKAISEYSKRFVNMSKEGNYVDQAAIKQSANDWVIKDLFTKHYTQNQWDGGHVFNIYKDLKTANMLNPQAEQVLRTKLVAAYGPQYGSFLDSITPQNPQGDQALVANVTRSTNVAASSTPPDPITGAGQRIAASAPVQAAKQIVAPITKPAEQAAGSAVSKGKATVKNLKKGKIKF